MSTQPIEPTPSPAYSRPAVVPAAPPSAGAGLAALAIRVVLTLAGAAGMIVGAMLNWFRTQDATRIAIRSLWGQPGLTGTFFATVGFAAVVLGLLAVVGLAPRSGWLTRIAGALGVALLVLFAIEVYRAPSSSLSDLGTGFWLTGAGSIVALVGGFFGTRYRVAYAAPVAEPEVAA